jgi:predicted RNA binding protein YcfA (HicA-like mRNA interferase family)
VSKFEKLIKKVFSRQQVLYQDAEKILFALGYELKISGSHYVFRKTGYKLVVLKFRQQLLLYQINDLREVLKDHGYKEI